MASLAAGYLMGSLADQSRYEQWASRARDLADDLGLAATAGALSGRASEAVNDARRRIA